MNKVMLIGNVGKEPEVKYYEADQAVATFPLATTEKGYTLPNGTVVPDRTDWHNVVLWRGLAKVAERYIHKGDKVYIEGKSGIAVTTTRKGCDDMSPKSMATTWSCSRQNRLQAISPRRDNKEAVGDPTMPF